MTYYIIWTPIWVSPDRQRVKILISLADFSEGVYLSRKFILNILKSLKIFTRPVSWKFTLCRSRYFSEYLESEDWRDIWTQVCIFEIDFDEKICESLANLEEPWISSSVSGSGKLDPLPDTELAHCIVVGDFYQFEAVQNLVGNIKEAKKKMNKKSTMLDSLNISIYWIIPIINGQQIIFDVGIFSAKDFSNGLENAGRLEACIRDLGGEIHHYHRL